MASAAAKIFEAFMAANEINISYIDEEETIMRVGWKLDNTKIADYIIFDEGDEHIQIQGRDFIQIPENKYDIMLDVINDCNMEYRWIKFYLHKEQGEIVAMTDAIIQLDSCAEEIDELMHRMNNIVDDAYTKFMKALWA